MKKIISVIMVVCLLLCLSSCDNKKQDLSFVIELDFDQAPITCENFVKLVEAKFYDGLVFHRILSDLIIQGGDPKGNGYGGPGYSIKGEFLANGVNNTISHTRGTISMARSNDFDSAGSQFFILVNDYTGWDGYYAAFGHVISGMEVVDAICAIPVVNSATGMPAEYATIESAVMIDNPNGENVANRKYVKITMKSFGSYAK